MDWQAFGEAVWQVSIGLLTTLISLTLFSTMTYVVQVVGLSNREFASTFRHRRVLQLSPESWTRAIFLVLAYGTYAYILGNVYSAIVGIDAFLQSAASILVCILFTSAFIDGIFFARSARRAKWHVLPASFDISSIWHSINPERQTRISLQLYWHGLLRESTPVVVLVTTVAVYGARTPDPESPVWTEWLLGLLTVGLLALTILTRVVPRAQLRFAPATLALLTLSDIESTIADRHHRVAPRMADPDPLDWLRYKIRNLLTPLDREAARLDRMIAPATPHPVASLLRKTSAELRTYMTSGRSIETSPSQEIRQVISDLMLVIAGPRHPGAYVRLAASVSAFTSDGSPVADPPKKRALADAVARTAQGSTAVKDLVTVVIVVGVLILIFTRRLDPSILGQLPVP